MTRSADMPRMSDSAEIRRSLEERARAELAAADALVPGSDGTPWAGALLAEVALVKGIAGQAEASGGDALSGADGEAADKALEALGWDPSNAFRTLSRPRNASPGDKLVERLRRQIEAADPALVLALDAEAATDVANAFGIALPKPGAVARVKGRRVLAVDGLEASLSHSARKKRVWRQLQAARPEGPAY